MRRQGFSRRDVSRPKPLFLTRRDGAAPTMPPCVSRTPDRVGLLSASGLRHNHGRSAEHSRLTATENDNKAPISSVATIDLTGFHQRRPQTETGRGIREAVVTYARGSTPKAIR